ncbi:sulfotransferase family 2 domain-containing protein [Demequina soli]|uniref:sulfotransferase family 2 domain-containing protein n=1 Tax=Demequina soli TaxID=1638987 RepID=UPI000782EB93|nr:sulfotransferase family 2 domain-containing protein [Demequina soli]
MEWRITVWDEPRLVYVAVAKVANTAVKAALLESYVEDTRWRNPHAEDMPYKTAEPGELATTYADHTVFSVVRNPYDRLVSFWADKIVGVGWYRRLGALGFTRNQSFAEAAAVACGLADDVTDPHAQSQVARLKADSGLLLPTELIRFERIDEDWTRLQELAAQAGARPLKSLTPRRVSQRDAWQDYYTDEVAAIVAERYREDFDLLGYDTAFARA